MVTIRFGEKDVARLNEGLALMVTSGLAAPTSVRFSP